MFKQITFLVLIEIGDFCRENIGTKTFIETAREPDNCKIMCVSALMNYEKIQNFLFRNYTYPPGATSHYPGSTRHKLWEAIRASSAAPGYFEEFELDGNVHQVSGRKNDILSEGREKSGKRF